MPDRTPEHNEHPPQWPPLPWQDESTSRPQPTAGSPTPTPDATPPEWPVPSRVDAEPPRATPPSPPHGFDAPADNTTGSIPRSPTTTFAAAPQQPTVPAQAGPPEVPSAPSAPPEAPAPKKVLAQAPPTHGRGVRMTIYGIGGAIAIGLIVVIIAMAGGTIIPPGLTSDDEEPTESLDLVTEDGEIDAEVYARLASEVGTETWIDWRLGGAADGEPTGDTVAQPETAPLDLGDEIEHVAQYGDDSKTSTAKNVQGQFAAVDGSGPGLGHVTTVEVTDSSIGFAPRPGGRFSADVGEPELADGSTAKCLDGADLGRVVAMDRADDTSRSAHAVVAFSTGAIATTGISGAQGGTCVQLPDGHVPTAVTVTPANEFALVTVWDVNETRGLLAVIALGDKAGTYASSWPSPFPGLPSPGHFGFAKLLGFVELPDVSAPTAVAVGTDYTNAFVDRRAADMSTTTGRAPFADDVASTGFVAVASTAERKVQWVDLTPLLTGVSKAYFSGDPSVYASPGAKPEAWPPSFEAAPEYSPTVTSVLELDNSPLAVAAVGGTAQIATADGGLIRFDVAAGDATETGKVDLPGPATCLVTATDQASVIATSRLDRSVTWIGVDDGAVQRTLRDSRLVDPVCAQDSPDTAASDGTGTSVRTVTVADFSGSALHTYRFETASLTDGTAFELKAGAFEYGGAFTTPGKPFAVSTALDQS